MSRRFWALLLPVGLSSVFFLYGAASRITAPYELEYGEGIVLWQAAHISSPSQAYHPIVEYPYVVFHYPPAFHVMSRIAAKVMGDLLLGGRLVTFGSALGIMFVLGAMVYRSQATVPDRTARWVGALAAAFLPAALPNVNNWVPQMRVDMFGLMLSLVSMWAFIEGQKRPALRYVAFVGFTVAVFAKQTLISAPLAALIVATIDDRKEALKLAGFAAIVGLIPLLAMQYATNGQFAKHLFLYNQNSYTVRRAIEMSLRNVRGALPVLALAATAIFFHFADSWRRGPEEANSARLMRDAAGITMRCLTLYIIFTFLMSWTSGKYGSASNYFLEFDLICCAFAGVAVTKAVEQSRRSATLNGITVGLLLLLAGTMQMRHLANSALHLTQWSRELAAARLDEAGKALELVRAAPGPVFSWDLMVVMLANKDIPLEPAIMFELSRTGVWDIAPFVKEIREGYYGLIVVNSDAGSFTSEAVSRAMASAYVPAEHFGRYRFYRPMPR